MKFNWKKWLLMYPVHAARGEWIPLYRREIQECESLAPNELHRFQSAKVARLLRHCYHNDPYYRPLLEGFVNRNDSDQPLSFLNKLPFLTKEIINRETAKRRVRWRHLDRRSTSGSTGFPLTFHKDRLATAYMEAVQNYACQWHDISVGEPQGRFWGMPAGAKGKITELKDLLKNRVRFSAFDLSDEAMHAFHQRLVRFSPTYFYGYPSLILEFANFLERERLSLDSVPLKAVIGTGEYVYPDEKSRLEELLGVPFVGEYGCTETGVIGFDCQHGTMHLMAANILVQVVDEEGMPVPAGHVGEIVVTELNARYFPFIRYRLGDRGSISHGSCPCGRTLPALKIAAGRKDDYIVTPQGQKVYDAILAYTLKKGVLQFKAVQDRLDRLRIYVVPDAKYNESLERDYGSKLQESLGSDMRIEFIRTAEIEREASGKLRYFRSDMGGKTP